MYKMPEKYNLKSATIKVGYPNGFNRYDPRIRRQVHVKPYERKQMVRDFTYLSKIIEHQRLEDDWSHLSNNYPNLRGLTDEKIESFIKTFPYSEDDRKHVKSYIKKIKCYDQNEIRDISRKMFLEFDSKMKAKASGLFDENPYDNASTIFITSPIGGFDILGDFGYANASNLSKKNFPYDLEGAKSTYFPESKDITLNAESLPYGYKILDVNDVIYVDDIYMSGEQCEKAREILRDKIKGLKISEKQMPRLHYMAIVGNKSEHRGRKGWDTFIVGEEHSFTPTTGKKGDWKTYEDVSAVVFPFSIPDGARHHIAQKLYKDKKRFEHRKFG